MPEVRDRRAAVVGRGVAGLTCATLLTRAGWDVELRGGPARPVPVVLLGSQTVELLESIWGRLELRGHALRGRVVRWGAAPSTCMADRALVIEGAALLVELERRCNVARAAGSDPPPAGDRWALLAQGRTMPGPRRWLGRRVVLNARAALRPDADELVSRMEAVGDGWLFLMPAGRDEAVLQAMVPAPPADPALVLERMLASSREVDARVSHIADDEIAVIPAAPHAREPLTSPGCLAVGDAARAHDPLAGDGTGHGLRSALLATAVLESIAGGMVERDALNHYAHRVRLSFLRHLVHCLRFYSDAFGASSSWQAELAALRRELSDPANRALAARPFAYRLSHRRLEPLL